MVVRTDSMLMACASLLLATVSPASAAPRKAQPVVATLTERAEMLKAGQFVWTDRKVGEGDVVVVVSLPLQRIHVYRDGTLLAASSVSTGKPGHDTPIGAFPILQKKVDHKSNLYDDAPMPFMQRLTWDGIALHAGRVTGAPASHGCVRLPRAFAQKLYDVTRLGATVYVTDTADLSPPIEAPFQSEPSLETASDPFTTSDEVTMIETTSIR